MKEFLEELWDLYKTPIYMLIAIVCLSITLVFTNISAEKNKYEIGNIVDDTFEVIDNKGSYAIVKDIGTGVCYWKKKGVHSMGSLCPVYDSNGNVVIKKK